ncbi:MAG: hypothetical protein Q7K42_02650 [Candidatus Diapherotrites archaeon]|nr:hypothetical protein [Candidatus Diapherotrites archaeon]
MQPKLQRNSFTNRTQNRRRLKRQIKGIIGPNKKTATRLVDFIDSKVSKELEKEFPYEMPILWQEVGVLVEPKKLSEFKRHIDKKIQETTAFIESKKGLLAMRIALKLALDTLRIYGQERNAVYNAFKEGAEHEKVFNRRQGIRIIRDKIIQVLGLYRATIFSKLITLKLKKLIKKAPNRNLLEKRITLKKQTQKPPKN